MADPTAKPWYTLDANGNMTQQNQGGTPQASSWTSGGLTTTGTLNPFGLKTNSAGGVIDPYTGYGSNANYSAYSPWQNSGVQNQSVGGTYVPAPPAPTPDASQGIPSNFNQDATQQTPTYGGGVPAQNNTVDVFGNIARNNAGTGTTPNQPSVAPPLPTPTAGTQAPGAGQTPQTPGPSTSAPLTATSTTNGLPGQSPFLQGVNTTSFSPLNNGTTINQPNNPNQFATPEVANFIAQLLGGSSYGQSLTGPGLSTSQPQQMINTPTASGINAGLAAQTINQYGGQAGSYGQYQLARDNSGNVSGFPSYDQWASTQPNYNPGTRAATATDTPQYLQNPTAPQYQQVPPNIPQAPAQNTSDLFSQLGSIMQLLSLLGITGGGGGGYQRPPALSQPSNLLGNYYSRFA